MICEECKYYKKYKHSPYICKKDRWMFDGDANQCQYFKKPLKQTILEVVE